MFGLIAVTTPAAAQDCNNNGIPDANELQGAHYSLNFDAIDDVVRIPRSGSIEQANELTFEAWVFAYGQGPFRANIARLAADFGAGYLFTWQWNGAGKIELRIGQATNGDVIVQDPTPNTTYALQWTHVAFTYSVSANSVKVFVNGVQKASAPAVGPLRYSNSDLYIGNTPFGADNDFDGRIDEVRMWSVARTQAEIAANMSKRLNAPQPGLVAYWRFDEGTGQTVQDSSLNSNHGFRGYNDTTETSDPLWLSIGAPITSNDCNSNAILDECDIAAATSPDCNVNGMPDECEFGGASDCNNNSTPDLCDIYSGNALDCNLNGVPDSCEIANGAMDMDLNGVLDSCTFPLVYERAKPCGRVYLAITGAIDGIRVHRRSGAIISTLLPAQVDYTGGTISFDSQNNLLVSDYNQDRVKVIARDGTLVRTISGGGLNGAHGATMTPSGTIAVCSYLTDSIKFYSMNGTYLSNLGHGNGTEDPHCIAYDRSGNLYVGCRNNGNGHVGKFNAQLQFVSYIGQGNFAPHPLDMAFDANQNLYVTTPGMIRKFNTSGVLVQTITQGGLDPKGISIDEAGRLWITNLTSRNIFRFTSTGDYIDTINIDLGANAPAALRLYGIALDVKPDGDCDNNGTSDACEIDAGEGDCDADGVPDLCQLAGNDCNANGVLDRCESGDCNNNGVIDICDIGAGTEGDCDGNDIPDSCELADTDITATGTIVAKIFSLSPPNPMGGGSQNPETIRDGVMPPVGSSDSSLQYDTYHQGAQGNEDWIGYTFSETHLLKKLVFQEGRHFNDGGWFDVLGVQVRVNGVWTSVSNLSVSPAYPGNNGISYETFNLTFTPVLADGIRLYGDGGGSAQHISIGELRVLTENDCNQNDVLDSCDIAAGTSGDCDANGIPDDCQPVTDCDNNGVRDLCEPAGRADCDGDGVTNYCQVAAGAPDCNSNWIPDSCDIAATNFVLKFDDLNDRVRVPRTPTLEPGAFTIECWARLNTIQSRNTRLVRKVSTRGFILAADQDNDQRIQIRVHNSATVVAADTQPHAAYVGEWHHFAATFTATQAKLYVDGVLKSTTNHATGPLTYTADDLYIGAGLPASDTSEFFGGWIDEVRFWSVARSQTDIAADRFKSFADARPGLVGYWKFNTGAGQFAVDSSGYGNHGQLGADTLPAGDSADPLWTTFVNSSPGPSDCNGNGIPDACDFAAGTVTDCNSNNVPDSCESDCNDNGIADACDISAGTVPDCNGNAIPDACDIAAGTSTDVNANGVPDACEPDIRVIPVISIIDPVNSSEIRSTQPASIAAVSRGTRYFIEVWASDVGSTNTGLTGVYTDVNFCGQTTATAVAHGGIFTVFPAGTIQSGKVDEFGGSALPNGGGIAPQWVRVGWIEMNAGTESPGCSISLSPATGGIAAFNRGLINNALITFGSISLAITPPAKSYDLDDNNTINVGDLSLFAASWLQTVPPGDTDHDFDCDDAVGVSDLSWFATGWLKSVTDPTILYPACNGGGGWGPGDEPGDEPTDVAFRIAVLSTPSSSDNRITVPNSITTINEGQQYYVEVWASDVGDINTGITSAYLDLMLPPTAAAVISINHNGIFTVFPSGAEDEGRIDELGGSHLNADAGASPIWSRVATVRLFADVHRPVKVFSLTPSTTGVAAYGRGSVSWNAISLDTLSIGTPGPGDIDADGDVDQADLPLFVNVLLGANTDPGHIARSDLNADTLADGRDISGFVGVLTAP